MADTGARVLKWIGAATAVISLLLGVRQIATIVSDRSEQARQTAERARESDASVTIARQQADRGEFAEAWQTLDRAEQQARSDAVDGTRLDIAFRWLEEARKPADQPFSSITDVVEPALDRAVVDEHHPRRADILAHMGWATFLKSRDSGSGDPAPTYRQALAIDPKNPYANAMLAHWLLWNRQPLETARPYLAAAVDSGKARTFVRRLQFAALKNRADSPSDSEMIRVADAMRRGGETLDPASARAACDVFTSRYAAHSGDDDPRHLDVSVDDLLATYAWLARLAGKEVDQRVVTTLTKAGAIRASESSASR
jgi:Tfp pilus assembly protein PilF